MFHFHTSDTWQIAYLHGHSAMTLLARARDIENQYVKNQSELAQLPHGEIEYINLGAQQHMLTAEMLKACGASIMLYQGMMEALINHAIETEIDLQYLRGKSFRVKWLKALSTYGKSTESFEHYDNGIYIKYRNPLVHPSDVTATTFDDLQACVIAQGFREGWKAYAHLYDGIGHPHDPDSWRILCEAHQLTEFA